MPTKEHQLILMYLLEALRRFVIPADLSIVLPAPLRVKVGANKFREPDIVSVQAAHKARARSDYFEGADLVMEVVSAGEKNRERDLVDKVVDYAEGGIPEYWVVDPELEAVKVYRREGERFTRASELSGEEGHTLSTPLLPGLSIALDDLFR